MKQQALLIIDLQNDFCPGGALAVREGDAVVQPLCTLARAFAQLEKPVFASRDWHPRNSRHFAEFGGVWPVHCVQNSSGADFHPDLRKVLQDSGGIIISTGTKVDEDGYSAFDGHTSTGQSLKEILEAKQVAEIFLGGLATDYCVRCSALDAANQGYQTHVMLDACRAVNLKPDDAAKAVEEMRRAGVLITSTADVLQLLRT